jgi:predicted RNA-binding Zn-ribbon protein involved in translation (DUF1610 family)
MIRTRTHCEWCGTVALQGNQYSVGVDLTTDVCNYHFDCPRCGRANRKRTSPRVATILLCLGAGVVADGWSTDQGGWSRGVQDEG